MLQGVTGHSGAQRPGGGPECEEGEEANEMGSSGLCPTRLLFGCLDAKRGSEFFFLLRNWDWRRGKEEEKSPVSGMISLECGM